MRRCYITATYLDDNVCVGLGVRWMMMIGRQLPSPPYARPIGALDPSRGALPGLNSPRRDLLVSVQGPQADHSGRGPAAVRERTLVSDRLGWAPQSPARLSRGGNLLDGSELPTEASFLLFKENSSSGGAGAGAS